MLPAVPGMTEGRAAAVDTSWGLSWWPDLHLHKGCLSPHMRDPACGMDLVFAQDRVKSETRVVGQGEGSWALLNGAERKTFPDSGIRVRW